MKRSATFRFRLYVADSTMNSAQALANLRNLCDEHLASRHEIEIVDVLLHPDRALKDAILMTPTLIKLAPAPLRRIVGTLSDTQTALHALGLDAEAA